MSVNSTFSSINTTGGGLGDAPVFDELNLISVLVKGTMFIVSLFGNLSTIVQMYRMRRRKSTINTLIINLATADLLVTFFCMGSDAIWQSTVQWYAGDFMCKAVKFAQVFAFNLSTYVTVVISLDRCFAIMDPISRNKAPRRVKFMIIVTWCLCALFSIPQILIFKVVKGPFRTNFVQCVDIGYLEVEWSKRVYSIVSLLFSFVIPLLIMGIAYGLISGTITRKSKDFREPEESSITSEHCQFRGQVRSHLFRKAKRKALRMSIVIVAAFIICWSPYYVVFMYTTFLELPEFSRKTMLALSFIGLSNSLLNPMIYGAFHLCKVHSPRSVRPNQRMRSLRPLRINNPIAKRNLALQSSNGAGEEKNGQATHSARGALCVTQSTRTILLL
ncbi:gonadotropin-releasing hormone receptor-like isoform X2 [Ruditapes philippinarum]|uniref:gonadotropin-releasing hormone receptor-like isoform X2 n=1 Tax=Ruditapes philippinarum TaxID=129788 RepID=UPI00295BB95B|nr:gonadotropin-releasing hormone receptor-like isoform X2 [Ruditapes philippinarum]